METKYRNPLVTVDIIIEINRKIVLIQRVNPPLGWALPGGFVDYGESLELCAIREAREETSLNIELLEQFHTYSDPRRDPRHHSISTVFIATASGFPRAADDAGSLGLFTLKTLPGPLVFDHFGIISDYFRYKSGIAKNEIFLDDPERGQGFQGSRKMLRNEMYVNIQRDIGAIERVLAY